MKDTVDFRLIRVPGPMQHMGKGLMGAFVMPSPFAPNDLLRMLSSGPHSIGSLIAGSGGWEHVSVSVVDRCPTWLEMKLVKEIFWDPGELVIQFHPPQKQYINNNEFVLHLWKSPRRIKLPPSDLV